MELDEFEIKTPHQKTVKVTIIAWLFILISFILIFSVVGSSIFFIPFQFNFSIVLLFIPSCIIYFAFNFMKYKEWARAALETVCWILLIIISISTLLFSFVLVEAGGNGVFSDLIGLSFLVFIFAVLIPFSIILGFLRSKTIKDAMRRG